MPERSVFSFWIWFPPEGWLAAALSLTAAALAQALWPPPRAVARTTIEKTGEKAGEVAAVAPAALVVPANVTPAAVAPAPAAAPERRPTEALEVWVLTRAGALMLICLWGLPALWWATSGPKDVWQAAVGQGRTRGPTVFQSILLFLVLQLVVSVAIVPRLCQPSRRDAIIAFLERRAGIVFGGVTSQADVRLARKGKTVQLAAWGVIGVLCSMTWGEAARVALPGGSAKNAALTALLPTVVFLAWETHLIRAAHRARQTSPSVAFGALRRGLVAQLAFVYAALSVVLLDGSTRAYGMASGYVPIGVGSFVLRGVLCAGVALGICQLWAFLVAPSGSKEAS